MSDRQPIIRTENLCKIFPGGSAGTDTLVLDGIDLAIEHGEVFGIIGRSGEGKSTLVRCINRLTEPTSGEIYFEGTALSALSKKELYKTRRQMGMIFQQFNLLLQRTAEDNVKYPLEIAGWDRKKATVRARELLGQVGMSDKAGFYPAQLSGGQRQRVAIARAIALEPKALLCDEATSALDPETTRGVLELLKDINGRLGITIVVITHEMSVIEAICGRVAILDAHKVAETGSVTEVFTSPKSVAARRLVYPEGDTEERPKDMKTEGLLRVVFDGNSAFEPVIAGMILRFRQKVNIMYANTRDIGGRAYGQIILQIPDDLMVAAAMREYLKSLGLAAENLSWDEMRHIRDANDEEGESDVSAFQ